MDIDIDIGIGIDTDTDIDIDIDTRSIITISKMWLLWHETGFEVVRRSHGGGLWSRGLCDAPD